MFRLSAMRLSNRRSRSEFAEQEARGQRRRPFDETRGATELLSNLFATHRKLSDVLSPRHPAISVGQAKWVLSLS
jgi:hypothetical protein